MPTPTQPNLGYGKPTEASIDQVNQWMRSTPWYQSQLRAWGQDPSNTHLSKEQSRQLLKMAQAQGVVVDEGDMEVDSSGNFNPKGHKLRNTLIVAGIAGATLATMGAAGAFAGAAGAGSAGSAGVGGMTATSLGLPATAGLGTAGTAAAAGSVGIGSRVAGLLRNPNVLGGAARALSAGAQSSASNRGAEIEAALAQDELRLRADADRRTGLNDARKQLAYANNTINYTPRTGPTGAYGLRPLNPTSDAQKDFARQMEAEMLKRATTPYAPTDISRMTRPGTGERIAGLAGAGLSIFDLINRR